MKRTGELMGAINTCLFSPESLSIVKGTPEDRRRFMDMALSQLYPPYFYSLVSYNAALKQRNALLKLQDTDQLLMWDAQLATHGARIMQRREEFINDLAHRASYLQLSISKGKELLRVDYAPSVAPSFDCEKMLLDAFAGAVEDDLRRGFSTKGPHRDDVSIVLDDTDVRYFGSQGQQRTAALALKLAERELMRSESGEEPVLLLDDVLSELDSGRQDFVLNQIVSGQVFITCCEPGRFTKLGKTMEISGGQLK